MDKIWLTDETGVIRPWHRPQTALDREEVLAAPALAVDQDLKVMTGVHEGEPLFYVGTVPSAFTLFLRELNEEHWGRSVEGPQAAAELTVQAILSSEDGRDQITRLLLERELPAFVVEGLIRLRQQLETWILCCALDLHQSGQEAYGEEYSRRLEAAFALRQGLKARPPASSERSAVAPPTPQPQPA